MKTLKILMLLLGFSTFITKPSEELEQAIIKTDLTGVKALLAQIKLDSVTKNRLLDLADNIILMRMKYVEIYSCKQITQADFDSICGVLSKETVHEVKDKDQEFAEIDKKRDLWQLCFVFFLILDSGCCAVMTAPDINIVCFGAIALFGAIGTILSSKKCSGKYTALQGVYSARHKCIRENLQKNYSDAILVKQLLLQTSVVDSMVYRKIC